MIGELLHVWKVKLMRYTTDFVYIDEIWNYRLYRR